MATSPTQTPKKEKKDESFFDKIGTIGRKKKPKEGINISEQIKIVFVTDSTIYM